jgi:hypothetical protein
MVVYWIMISLNTISYSRTKEMFRPRYTFKNRTCELRSLIWGRARGARVVRTFCRLLHVDAAFLFEMYKCKHNQKKSF